MGVKKEKVRGRARVKGNRRHKRTRALGLQVLLVQLMLRLDPDQSHLHGIVAPQVPPNPSVIPAFSINIDIVVLREKNKHFFHDSCVSNLISYA